MPRGLRRLRPAAGALVAISLTAILCVNADAATRSRGQAAKSHHQHHVRGGDDLGRPPKPDIPGPIKFTDSQIEPVPFSELSSWQTDDHAAAFKTFRAGCRAVIAKARNGTDDRPVLPALAETCRRALVEQDLSKEAARTFFETNFRPIRISKLGDSAGFLTGYYEPIVEGSRFPTRDFTVPVYRRPPDLIPPAGAAKGASFPNTGKSMRRNADGALVPYYERAEIENGVYDGQRLEICWLRDPIDLFFIQIQGSGRVRLEDGTMLRINYDSHNGHPYTAIGRILIERGLVPREEMSMDRIRQWMSTAPDGGKELRGNNKSYVFFRITGLSDDYEPAGAQGVPLTPGRSIAVDKALHVYGTPFYIEAQLPITANRADSSFHRTMIAQDTGSAIIGPARADIYYGAGDEAGRIAGRFRHPGRFAMLIPRALDPVVAGEKFPLPPVRPAKESAKKETAPKDGGKPGAKAVAVGTSNVPLPATRPKAKPRQRPRV